MTPLTSRRSLSPAPFILRPLGCLVLCLTAAGTLTPLAARADVVQINVKDVLNANVIVKKNDVPEHTKQTAADLTDFAYCTQKAAEGMTNDNPRGLPDDGKFAATDRHPEVQLSYRNNQEGANARRCGPGDDRFDVNVPKEKFSELAFLVAGGNGTPNLVVTLAYDDGTTEERRLAVQDWCVELEENADQFVLVKGMDRVQIVNNTYDNIGLASIYGYNLHPNKDKVLKGVSAAKSGEAVLCFFGATGQTAGK